MKKITTLLCLLLLCSSCAQQPDKKKPDTPMNIDIHNQHINATNFVDEIAQQVKEYDSQPFYFLRIAQEYCMYEVFVNGELIEKQYSLGVLASPIEINFYCLAFG